MNTTNESAERIKKLTERLSKYRNEVERAQLALKEEERKRRLQQDNKLRKEKIKWKADLGKKLIHFYPLPIDEIESIIRAATSQQNN